ncbi:biofilm/acid-resistance regulator YmgB/AriR [Rahnella variigena]|jgi:hypothetical protein|uniref:biofilm/acid-resistance regulator YmgB/AriR n=1 Tax=Rahnella variigena TaxID=574964 RepID=UPI003D2C4221
MTTKSINTRNLMTPSPKETALSQCADNIQNSLFAYKVYQHFITAGEPYASETEVLGCAIRAILKERGHVNNKAIILHLILQLESSSEVVQMDILRNALEMVVGITPDDADI